MKRVMDQLLQSVISHKRYNLTSTALRRQVDIAIRLPYVMRSYVCDEIYCSPDYFGHTVVMRR